MYQNCEYTLIASRFILQILVKFVLILLKTQLVSTSLHCTIDAQQRRWWEVKSPLTVVIPIVLPITPQTMRLLGRNMQFQMEININSICKPRHLGTVIKIRFCI